MFFNVKRLLSDRETKGKRTEEVLKLKLSDMQVCSEVNNNYNNNNNNYNYYYYSTTTIVI